MDVAHWHRSYCVLEKNLLIFKVSGLHPLHRKPPLPFCGLATVSCSLPLRVSQTVHMFCVWIPAAVTTQSVQSVDSSSVVKNIFLNESKIKQYIQDVCFMFADQLMTFDP